MKHVTEWKCGVRSRFWIRSAELTVDMLRQTLGVEPEASYPKDESLGDEYPSPFHRFVLMNSSQEAEGAGCLGCMEAEIERMLGRVDAIAPRLATLQGQVELEMRVFYQANGGFIPLDLSPDLLRRLSALGCTLKLHVGYDQHKD
ncbi:MAG: DUF4279 domain-containing protein [Verrucomicrobiaceae bacterium]|nr:MAG: DUF4279 domain-containing protein [Verrucomicrobiaceae bacterium]